MKNPYPAYYPFFFALVNVFIRFFIYYQKNQKIKIKFQKNKGQKQNKSIYTEK